MGQIKTFYNMKTEEQNSVLSIQGFVCLPNGKYAGVVLPIHLEGKFSELDIEYYKEQIGMDYSILQSKPTTHPMTEKGFVIFEGDGSLSEVQLDMNNEQLRIEREVVEASLTDSELSDPNCMILLKDRRRVMGSLISVLIAVALYIVFLGHSLKSNFPDVQSISFLVDSWAMAGIVAIASITASLSSLAPMIRDRETGRSKDLLISPITPVQIAFGYIFSAIVVGFIMCLITFFVAELYIVAAGGALLSPAQFAQVVAVIMLTVVLATSIMLFIVSLFQSMDTFGHAATIISALSGFLVGLYLPIGSLPPTVSNIIKVFPISHGAVLLRQIMMNAPLTSIFAGDEAARSTFEQMLGVQFTWNGSVISSGLEIGYMLLAAGVFFVMATFVISKKQKEV